MSLKRADGRPLRLILALAVLALMLSACSDNRLVGSWKTSLLGINQILTFHADGTVQGAMLGFSAQLPLRYKVSGDKLTLTVDGALTGGSGASSATLAFILQGDTLYLDGIEYTRIK